MMKEVYFFFSDDVWCVSRERSYVGGTALEYCSFNTDCSGLVLLTHNDYHLLHDSQGMPVAENKGEAKKSSLNRDEPMYRYQQTDGEHY